jgi:hypothetical protein
MVYSTMRRTNIYLADEQLTALRRLGERRGASVAVLIREAVDAWLASQGVRGLTEDEWERRFGSLLARRREAATTTSADVVEREVARAVSEVRRARAARGR